MKSMIQSSACSFLIEPRTINREVLLYVSTLSIVMKGFGKPYILAATRIMPIDHSVQASTAKAVEKSMIDRV